jgi:hypothetical protein
MGEVTLRIPGSENIGDVVFTALLQQQRRRSRHHWASVGLMGDGSSVGRWLHEMGAVLQREGHFGGDSNGRPNFPLLNCHIHAQT